MFDVDQAGWGSALEYPDDPEFKPRYVVLHWGGGTSQIPADGEESRLRIWQTYHRRINPDTGKRVMRDIAYNYAIGDETARCFRLRGLNPGGHVKCSTDRTPEGDSYCQASVGVVLVTGANDTDGFSEQGLARLGQLIRDLESRFGPLEVKAHSTVKQENGSNTACPGDQIREWIDSKGWEQEVDYEKVRAIVREEVAAALGGDAITLPGDSRPRTGNQGTVNSVWHAQVGGKKMYEWLVDAARSRVAVSVNADTVIDEE